MVIGGRTADLQNRSTGLQIVKQSTWSYHGHNRGCAMQATGHRVGGSYPSSGPRRLMSTPVAVHLLPSEKVVIITGRARAQRTVSLSQGRGWTATGVFTSGRGTGEGSSPGHRTVAPKDVKLLLPPQQSPGVSQQISTALDFAPRTQVFRVIFNVRKKFACWAWVPALFREY